MTPPLPPALYPSQANSPTLQQSEPTSEPLHGYAGPPSPFSTHAHGPQATTPKSSASSSSSSNNNNENDSDYNHSRASPPPLRLSYQKPLTSHSLPLFREQRSKSDNSRSAARLRAADAVVSAHDSIRLDGASSDAGGGAHNLFVCVYVYVSVQACVSVQASVCACTVRRCVHECVSVKARVCTRCLCVCVCVCVCVCAFACVCEGQKLRISARVYDILQTYRCIFVCICMPATYQWRLVSVLPGVYKAFYLELRTQSIHTHAHTHARTYALCTHTRLLAHSRIEGCTYVKKLTHSKCSKQGTCLKLIYGD